MLIKISVCLTIRLWLRWCSAVSNMLLFLKVWEIGWEALLDLKSVDWKLATFKKDNKFKKWRKYSFSSRFVHLKKKVSFSRDIILIWKSITSDGEDKLPNLQIINTSGKLWTVSMTNMGMLSWSNRVGFAIFVPCHLW